MKQKIRAEKYKKRLKKDDINERKDSYQYSIKTFMSSKNVLCEKNNAIRKKNEEYLVSLQFDKPHLPY